MYRTLPAVTALIASVLLAAAQGEPSFEGRTMAEWIALMNATPASHQAVYALGEIGEPALPTLIQAMRSHPLSLIHI